MPSFASTWGCQMISFMLDSILYGVSLILIGQYFRSHSERDSRILKGVVALLGVTATLQYVFLSHQMYQDFVNYFGTPKLLDLFPFSSPTHLLFIHITAFIAQCFFASRIWNVSHSSILWTAPVVVLALLQISAGIAQTIFVFHAGRFSKLHSAVGVTAARSVQSAAAAACDVCITAILCRVLHGSRSGIKQTDSIIDTMILYAINRGAATSAAALANLILFLTTTGTFIFMIPLIPSCQLYVISVVSMLSTRNSLRQNLNGKGALQSLSGSNIPMSSISSQGGPRAPDPTQFDMQKQVLQWRDDEAVVDVHKRPSMV